MDGMPNYQQNFPRPIKIHVFYDHTLQAITEKEMEEAVISEGMPFILFLRTILTSYPEIEILHPPGVLGFAVNGVPPSQSYVLQEGDVVEFVAHEDGRRFYERLFE